MKNPVHLFVQHLYSSPQKPFVELFERQFAGVFFLYIQLNPQTTRTEWESYLQKEAESFITGTEWLYEFSYVRTALDKMVYTFRFRVPDEKSFCCGNLCVNCILKRSTSN